jgi:arsenite methyltransferase
VSTPYCSWGPLYHLVEAPERGRALAEAWRVLRPGGVLQFADIANGNPVPPEAIAQIDLWTG